MASTEPVKVIAAFDLSGTWFAEGGLNNKCDVTQKDNHFSFVNERGEIGHGAFYEPSLIDTAWPDNPHRKGHIRSDGSRIDWDNNSFWTRQTQKDKECRINLRERAAAEIVWYDRFRNDNSTSMVFEGYQEMSGSMLTELAEWEDRCIAIVAEGPDQSYRLRIEGHRYLGRERYRNTRQLIEEFFNEIKP